MAISTATALCQDTLKKNPKFKYPTGTIEDLHQFNNLQCHYTISGVKKPGLASLLETAISATQRAPPPIPTKPPVPRSGIYHACLISSHAAHFLKFKEIKKTNHKSILNDIELCRKLFQWASTQKIGEVSSI